MLKIRKVERDCSTFMTSMVYSICIIVCLSIAIPAIAVDRITSDLSKGDKLIELPNSRSRILLQKDGTYRISRDGVSLSRKFKQKRMIRFKRGSIDPLVTRPKDLLPQHFQFEFESRKRNHRDARIVQFVAQPIESIQRHLKSLGVKLYAPLADQAFIVHMDADTATRVEKLSFIRWVGDYSSGLKLDETVINDAINMNDAMKRYSILVMSRDENMQEIIADRVKSLGGKVDSMTTGRRMIATLNGYGLSEVSKMKEVLYIDAYKEPGADMDIAREISGANYLESIEGYTGHGVRAEVMDSGLRISHKDFQANTPIIHGKNGSKPDHGTSVFGIVFGSGANNSRARGLLPDAEQPIFSAWDSFNDRMTHTAELVNPSGPYRAVFQTNSWGNGLTIDYSTESAEMDDILFANDIVILQSQSNRGNKYSRPEAWAKNIISIGGVSHKNTLKRSDDKWKDGYGGASIGPASDGRIKPDLWHFYDKTLTTSNSNDTSYREFGGTSGATPIVAGHVGLLFQMWADGVFDGGPGKNRDVFDSRPHMTTIKALLINSAYQYPFTGTSHNKTRIHQGWGMPDLKNLYNLAENSAWELPILIDESEVIRPGTTHTYNLNVTPGSVLKASMVYADPAGTPGSSRHRVNDLTLKVTSPSNVVYWGNNGLHEGVWSAPGGSPNDIDTVENVFIENAEAGNWTIEVLGDEIIQDSHVETTAIDADYALVVSADVLRGNPPTIIIGTPADNSAFSVNTTITFTGSANDVEDGNLSGQLKWTSNIDGNLGDGGTLSTTLSEGVHTIKAAATDSDELSGSDTITVTITVPQAYASLPYSTGFENDLDQYWKIKSSYSKGRILVTSNDGPRGASHLTMDVSESGNYNLNQAMLRLDLSGNTQVNLSFWWKEFKDEDDDEDGVFISDDDGKTFVNVHSFTGNNTEYKQITLDIDQLASDKGLSLSNTFVVKFQQYDNYPIGSDGFAFDDIEVTTGSEPVNKPPTANANGPYSGVIDSEIHFSSTGSDDQDGWIDSYLWDFGDGTTSSDPNPSHTYTSEDTYTVSLTVTDNKGAKGKDTTTVNINTSETTYNFGNESEYYNTSKSNNRRAIPFTMPENGFVNSVTMYHKGGQGKMVLAVYDGESKPTNRIGVTASTDVNSNEGWQTINLSNNIYVQGGSKVWLAWVYENNPGIQYKSGSPGRCDAGEAWTDGMPDLFGGCSQSSYLYSIYATYTTE